MSDRSVVAWAATHRREVSPRRTRPHALAAALLAAGVALLLGGVLDDRSEAASGTVTVSGVVKDGVAAESPVLEGALVQAFYLDVDRAFWSYAPPRDDQGTISVTGTNGAFALVLDEGLLVEGRQWVLTVTPPLGQDGTTGIPTRGANIFPLAALDPSSGPTLDAGDLVLQAPDVIGRVTDLDLAGTPLANAFLALEVDVALTFDGQTQQRSVQLPVFLSSSSGDGVLDGHFAVRRPDPRDFVAVVRPFLAPDDIRLAERLMVRSNDRFDLVTFAVDLGADDVALNAVTARFPTPTVTGTLRLTEGGSGVPGASFWVERLIVEEFDDGPTFSFWSFVAEGGQTSDGDDAGRFAAVIPSEPGVEYRLFFDRPAGGGPYPAFAIEIADLDPLLNIDAVYPAADLYGSVDLGAAGTSGVVSVQRRVTDDFGIRRWQWTDISSSLAFVEPSGSTVKDFVLADTLLGNAGTPSGIALADLRLRVAIFAEGGGETSFVVPVPAKNVWLGSAGEPDGALRIVPPAPNVAGIVRAPLGDDGALVALGQISVELRRFDPTFRFYDWTDIQTITRGDGTFSLVVPDDLADQQLELRIRPLPQAMGAAQLSAFSVPIDLSGDMTGLDITAALAPLRGNVCGPGCDDVVGGAWVQLERAVETPFGTFWDWTEGFATTTPSGDFALDLPSADPTAQYRLRVFPPFIAVGSLVEFTVELPGLGIGHAGLNLEFPAPNIGGSVVAPTGTPGSTAPVGRAWVTLQAWNETLGGWEWITSAETSRERDGSPGGIFQMFADPELLADRPLRLDVRNPGDRDDLVPFQQEFTLGPDGTVGLPGLTFPTPNLDVTIEGMLGGTVRSVPYAFAWVERVLLGGRTEQLDLWQSAGVSGRLALRIEEPGDYRLHVHAPWGVDLPTFQQDFTIAAGGAVSGLPATLTFPTPNLTVMVEDAAGEPVRFAHLELRLVDPDTGEEQWLPQNGTSDRFGAVSLALAPGDYRLYVTPPWFDRDLSLALVEVTVPATGAASATVVLRAPNLVGTLDQGSGVEGGAWMEVVVPEGAAPVPGMYVAADGPVAGEFRLSLPTDGVYTLVTWPGRGNATTMPLEVVVTVDGGQVTAWRYAVEAPTVDRCPASGPCLPDPSFTDAAVAPNFGGTVLRGGDPVEGAFVNVIATGAGSAGTPADWRGLAVSGADGTFRLRIPTDLTVEVIVVLPEGEAILIAEPPGTFDAGSGLANTLEVENLLRLLGQPPAGEED